MSEGDRPSTDMGLATLVSQLAADAREVGKAEIGLAKARAVAAVGRYKVPAILFAAAAMLAFAGLIALLVGLIATLTPRTGPGWATAIVCGLAVSLAAILALIGRSRLA